jgi:hypothetical protein
MSNLKKHYETVDAGIKMLEIDPTDAKGQKEGQWDFDRGSAKIAVGVTSTDRFPNGYFYVSSIIMETDNVPAEKKPELYLKLLELNATLVNMRFAFNKDVVFLISNRDANGLDPQEVAITINELSYYADMLDDRLQEEFIPKA